ncbi:triacylglycerol lipase [Xylariales sp. PMI_506]|nr:triacylglycerol lipase [Xylariales sp. PMI_506]
MASLTKPDIFVFSLGSAQQQSLMQEVHSSLMSALANKYSLQRANNAEEALGLLEQNDQPRGVLVTDPGIVASKNLALSRKLSDYVRNGGRLVFGGVFSGEIRPNELGKYMKEKWDLPWEAGSYHRTTLYLNEQVANRPTSGLPSSYSQKAVFLKHVDPDTAWYVATDRSVVESLVPLPGSEIDLLETAVAFASVGDGWIGYVGDVNAEAETDTVILAMFDLDPEP